MSSFKVKASFHHKDLQRLFLIDLPVFSYHFCDLWASQISSSTRAVFQSSVPWVMNINKLLKSSCSRSSIYLTELIIVSFPTAHFMTKDRNKVTWEQISMRGLKCTEWKKDDVPSKNSMNSSVEYSYKRLYIVEEPNRVLDVMIMMVTQREISIYNLLKCNLILFFWKLHSLIWFGKFKPQCVHFAFSFPGAFDAGIQFLKYILALRIIILCCKVP